MQYAPLLGRILFSAVFLMFGIGHFADAANMAANMVPDFVPAPTLVVYATGLWIVVAGAMVLLGYRTKVAGLMLFVFLFPTALLVHAGGFASGDPVGTAMFMKDLALAGGALLIFHFGAGPYSLDAKNAAT